MSRDSTASAEPPRGADTGDPPDGAFANSAHPPIQRLNDDLSPEEFESVFRANRAETIIYRIISGGQGSDDDPVVLPQRTLTLYRKQADGRRQVCIRFQALGADHADWVLDAPVFEEEIVGAMPNDPTALEMLAEAVTGEIRFDIEDCLHRAGKMSFGRLLHLMEAARIGRPSTYAATLKRLFEDSTVVTLDRATGAVTLTPNGVELGARLQTRCDDPTSKDFAMMFDRKLNAMAEGILPPKDFLTWVLSLTHPGDPLANVVTTKLWDSVDDLRADRVSRVHGPDGNGGYINHPSVSRPDPIASRPSAKGDT